MRKSNLRPLIVTIGAALLGFGLVAFLMSGRQSPEPTTQNQANIETPAGQTPQDNARAEREQQQQAGAAQANDGSLMSQIFGLDETPKSASPPEKLSVIVPKILWRLALAALLAALLAYRPRSKHLPIFQRNPYVAQTQILLAVVASALMMIVGDNAARAFGIFAAASLVRFRTNISDPKEITVLLVSLGIGLATGVGRWELAIVLALFVLPLLWVLEFYEPSQSFRAMELTVKTRDTRAAEIILKRLFRKYRFPSEIRQLDPPDEQEPVGCVVYHVNVSMNVSTDRLSKAIFDADPQNIEVIEWEQQKSNSYIYK